MHDNKVLNDLKKLAASSFATVANIRDEVSKMVKEQVKCTLKSLDIVTRSEFEVVKRTNEKLRDEINGIKIHMGGNTMLKKVVKKVAKKVVAKKPAAKKVAKKK